MGIAKQNESLHVWLLGITKGVRCQRDLASGVLLGYNPYWSFVVARRHGGASNREAGVLE